MQLLKTTICCKFWILVRTVNTVKIKNNCDWIILVSFYNNMKAIGNTPLGKENISNKKGSFSHFTSNIKQIEVDQLTFRWFQGQ